MLDTILQYLQSEHSDKLKTELPDAGIWQQNATIAKPPQQSNWFDCGVFMCQFCKSLASGEDLNIRNQEFVTRFARTSMTNEIKIKISYLVAAVELHTSTFMFLSVSTFIFLSVVVQ